jgi:hypothetical protein
MRRLPLHTVTTAKFEDSAFLTADAALLERNYDPHPPAPTRRSTMAFSTGFDSQRNKKDPPGQAVSLRDHGRSGR